MLSLPSAASAPVANSSESLWVVGGGWWVVSEWFGRALYDDDGDDDDGDDGKDDLPGEERGDDEASLGKNDGKQNAVGCHAVFGDDVAEVDVQVEQEGDGGLGQGGERGGLWCGDGGCGVGSRREEEDGGERHGGQRGDLEFGVGIRPGGDLRRGACRGSISDRCQGRGRPSSRTKHFVVDETTRFRRSRRRSLHCTRAGDRDGPGETRAVHHHHSLSRVGAIQNSNEEMGKLDR